MSEILASESKYVFGNFLYIYIDIKVQEYM